MNWKKKWWKGRIAVDRIANEIPRHGAFIVLLSDVSGVELLHGM